MDQNIEKVIHLVEVSALDQTIKDILIRDLKAEGLNDFIKEQIRAYCLEGLKKIDAEVEEAKRLLEKQGIQNPDI